MKVEPLTAMERPPATADDRATVDYIISQSPFALREVKQKLFELGMWPSDGKISNSTCSTTSRAAADTDSLGGKNDSSGSSGERPSSSSDGRRPAEAQDTSAKASAGEGSDDTANANDGERSDDSAPRPEAGVTTASAMDCLPPDAVVWVEDEAAPVEVRNLAPGHRVLCFDSLGRQVRYVEVTDVREDQELVEWADLKLADGTRTRLTADHPVQLAGSGALQTVVRARDIVPKESSIVVQSLVTRSVVVDTVTTLPPGLVMPSGRVSLAVKQPDRNAILVASPEQSRGDTHFVAVGSTGLAPHPFSVFRTFLHSAEPMVSPEEVQRRSHSWPPSVGGRYVEPLNPVVLTPPSGSSGGAADSSAGSFQESSSDDSSNSDTVILLPWILPRRRDSTRAPDEPSVPGRVSELLQAKEQLWPSIGSASHRAGTCRPCTFAHQGRCTAGIWCPHCHCHHVKSRGRLLPAPMPQPMGS